MIHVASTNAGKIAEFRLGLRLWLGQGIGSESGRAAARRSGQGSNWIIEPVPEIESLPACIEDGATFSANAQKKAFHYSSFAAGLILGDDSGLEVDALGGAPGVRSRRFAGDTATDAQNNALLLQRMAGVPAAKRGAQFECVLSLAQSGRLLAEFRGVARGVILEAPRGAGGFGYDPLFLDPQFDKTFAEFQPQDKFERSHRGRAFLAMMEWLAAQSG